MPAGVRSAAAHRHGKRRGGKPVSGQRDRLGFAQADRVDVPVRGSIRQGRFTETGEPSVKSVGRIAAGIDAGSGNRKGNARAPSPATLEGPAFRLRPVCLEDAPFIVELRADPDRRTWTPVLCHGRGVAGTMDSRSPLPKRACYSCQEIRTTGAREGTAGIYAINPMRHDAEWGRWILRRGSLAALESACLVYRLGFETLGLESIYCRTISENTSALAFHDSFGVERMRRLPRYFDRDGRHLDAVEGRLTRARWTALREGVEKKAARAAGWTNPAYAAAASGNASGT